MCVCACVCVGTDTLLFYISAMEELMLVKIVMLFLVIQNEGLVLCF